MLVPFSSSFHPLINKLDTAGFSDLLGSYSIYFCFANYFLSTFISFASNICLVFDVSAVVSSAYVIIGRTVVFYIFYFVSFLIYLSTDCNSSIYLEINWVISAVFIYRSEDDAYYQIYFKVNNIK
jgi:hypothetical protein